MFNFIKKYLFSILMTLIVFTLSVIDFSSVHNVPKVKYSDKIAHLLLYTIWTIIILFERNKIKPILTLKSVVLLLLIPIFFGGAIEIIQQNFFPPRTAELLDWLSDILGAIFGCVSLLFLNKKK